MRQRSFFPPKASLEAICDAPLGEIIGRHLDQNLVANENADAVLPHLSGRMSDDLMSVFELHPEGGVWQQFRDCAGKFEKLFFRHSIPFGSAARRPSPCNPGREDALGRAKIKPLRLK